MLAAHRVVLSPEKIARATPSTGIAPRRAQTAGRRGPGCKPRRRAGCGRSVIQAAAASEARGQDRHAAVPRRGAQALKAQVWALKASGKPEDAKIDVATFKARFDVSRKFAIPLLEYLDRARVTRRVGDARVIL
jgi:hypothetical protein